MRQDYIVYSATALLLCSCQMLGRANSGTLRFKQVCDSKGWCFIEQQDYTCMHKRSCRSSPGYKIIDRQGEIVQVVTRYEDGDEMEGFNCDTNEWINNYNRFMGSETYKAKVDDTLETEIIKHLCQVQPK